MHEIKLNAEQPFSLDQTLACGQVFRWEKCDGTWHGVVSGHLIRIKQDEDVLQFSGADHEFIKKYFSLSLSLPKVLDDICGSVKRYHNTFACDLFQIAFQTEKGLRIINQPFFECLISYICSTNSNIPVIKKRVKLLSEKFGKPCMSKGTGFFSFPEPKNLANADLDELISCKLGYRANYVKKTAEMFVSDKTVSEKVKTMPYTESRNLLMKYSGVGPKVADCVLLFACQRYEAVPVDVWIRRLIENGYLRQFETIENGSSFSYDYIADFCREYFGDYAGYAQQYLYSARSELQKRIDV